MAGLTSNFHISCKPHLPKPYSPCGRDFSFRVTFPPITTRTTISTSTTFYQRYGAPGGNRGGGAGNSRKVKSDDDEALDISSIKSGSVRLIDEEQKMVGIVSKAEAVRMAEDAELDLVILSPDADPPVLRIMDYNKYRYEQQKKKRDQQKKSAASRMDLKELKMGYNIDDHDYSVRLKAAQKFLKDGDKVKVIVNLKGRENEFRSNAVELIRRFQNDVGELAVEGSVNLKDRNMSIVLVPNKAVVHKSQEVTKTKENSKVSATV